MFPLASVKKQYYQEDHEGKFKRKYQITCRKFSNKTIFPQINSYISCPQEAKNSTQIETKEGKTGKKSATKSVCKKAAGGKQAKTGIIKKVVEKKTKKEVQPLIYEVIGNQKQVKSRKRSKSEKEER
jgi:hypothetical protein